MATKNETIKFADLINDPETKQKFVDILGKQSAAAFLQTAIMLVEKDPELQKADQKSLLNAVFAIASLDLMIDPTFGQAFLSKYKVKDGFVWKTFVQFEIGYKGLIELGYRTGQFKEINAIEVRENEFVGVDRLRGKYEFNWNQDQDKRNKLPVIGFVAFFELKSGVEKTLFMTISEMNEHAKKWSKKFKDPEHGWFKNFDGMGTKTVLKLLLDRYAPKSRELKRAITLDQSVINDIEGENLNYIDNAFKKSPIDLETHNAMIERKRFVDFITNAKSISKLEQCFEQIPDDEIRKLYDERKKELTKKNK